MNAREKLSEAQEHYTEANRIVVLTFADENHPKRIAFKSLLEVCREELQKADAVDKRPIELVEMILYDTSGSMETKTTLSKKAVMDRNEISKVGTTGQQKKDLYTHF